MKRTLTILLAAMLAALSFAQHGQLAAMRSVVDGGYNFWLYAPKEYVAEGHRVPVIIFLHGASLCGRNLQRVRRYGLLDAIEAGRYYPCMVVAPQNPGGPWAPEKIARVLDWVEAHHDIDTTRVYVIGMSLGGYGTLDFAGTYPDRVAAAMALCGGSTLKDFAGLAGLLRAVDDRLILQSVVVGVVPPVAVLDGSRLLGIVPQLGEPLADGSAEGYLREVVLRHGILGRNPGGRSLRIVVLEPAVGVGNLHAEIVVHHVAALGGRIG